MKLIAKECYVSTNAVSKVLNSAEIKNRKNHLPEAIGIYGFKS